MSVLLVCTMCKPGACGGPKGVGNLLELVLQVVMSHCVAVGAESRPLLKWQY